MTGQTQSEREALTQKEKHARQSNQCCGEMRVHPDHGSELGRLRRIQGQLAGIERMVTERRYCADVLVQCRAAGAALRAFEGAILETHLRDCVRKAIESKDRQESEKKINELMDLFVRG